MTETKEVIELLKCKTCGGSGSVKEGEYPGYRDIPCPDCTAPEQPNCEGCEFFKHYNKHEHCWRYTQLTSVCKLRQDHKEQPPASELTDWLRKTISGDRYNKGDKELQAKVREACDVIDRAEAENKRLQISWANENALKEVAYSKRVELEAKLKAKDKLLYAYESVKAPVNPLLAINKDLLKACELTYERIRKNGNWDDNCFYYHNTSASELEEPLELLKAAIAKQS